MRRDWVGIIEAAYAPARDDVEWARRVLDVSDSLFDGARLSVHVVEHGPNCRDPRATVVAGEPQQHEIQSMLTAASVDDLSAAYYPSQLVLTAREGMRARPKSAEHWQSNLDRHDVSDAIGLITHPVPGVVLVIAGGMRGAARLPPAKRNLLTRIALHLETGLRLRRRPEIVTAIVSTEGKLLHREREAPHLASIAARVSHVERARRRHVRREPEAVDLWQALVDGHSSLVERTEGSKRHYLVVENAPARQSFRALTKGEVDVVSFAARGLSAKLVAYALGVSAPVVSARLASAAAKIGVASRLELVRIAAMLTRDPRARFEDIALTAAERDVLELLQRGLSNTDIAKIRNRSVRTIANQVAQLLRKTKSPSRRALVAHR